MAIMRLPVSHNVKTGSLHIFQSSTLQFKIISPKTINKIPTITRTNKICFVGTKSSTMAEAQAETTQSAKDAAKPDIDSELKKKLETKEKEVIEWKDKYLRSVADFRNLQDRTQRDMKAARDFAIQKFAKDLVDSVDNLDRALIMGQEKLKPAATEKAEAAAEGEKVVNEDLKNFYEGVKMTETNMLQTLQKHGLERFDPEGHKFNPNEHEATFMTPMPDKEDNTVFHVQQKGFKLNGRILRAAKVGVVKNASS
ncbi:putative mitochondrial co-chaperone protein [Eutypa lata UCREL1]|uniref:GrpE protein homolog n=1 Tax=Eutypa lata (strain UCR-EL1) TaxID=1287681 RepID=M7SQL1_EUTLA|nr:putative mitochondrial co-chaperone protein [Eutypa lata UCREL1]